jgi:hypothetical protein
VRMDVLEGFVSPEAALNDYGVVLKPDGHPRAYELDAEATQKLRAAKAKEA